MEEEKTSLIEFPCHFPVKVMGKNTEIFPREVLMTVQKHLPETKEDHLSTRLSARGNYLSATVTVYVSNQAQLDAIYQSLTDHPMVDVVL